MQAAADPFASMSGAAWNALGGKPAPSAAYKPSSPQLGPQTSPQGPGPAAGEFGVPLAVSASTDGAL